MALSVVSEIDCRALSNSCRHTGEPRIEVRDSLSTDEEGLRIVHTEILNPWFDHADLLMDVLQGSSPKESVLKFMTEDQLAALDGWMCDCRPTPWPESAGPGRMRVFVPVQRRGVEDDRWFDLSLEFALDDGVWRLASHSLQEEHSRDR